MVQSVGTRGAGFTGRMPPKSPLPPRHGLQAAWVRTPDRDRDNEFPWPTMREFLHHKLATTPEDVDRMLEAGDFVLDDGTALNGEEVYRPHTFVWFHRTLRDEAEVPGEIIVLHRDERIVVIDKPHFLSTIPRGKHVAQSVVVRARRKLDLPELSPAHRLDRNTAGVLLLTTERRWRGTYQELFRRREAHRTYEAIAPFNPGLSFPRTVESHIVKHVGTLQAQTPDLPPNSRTEIDLVEVRGGLARYEVRPLTGRTHQIRVHFNLLGLPILGDPLYPRISDVSIDDFSTPLRLLASRLSFTDPVDGRPRNFEAVRKLEW